MTVATPDLEKLEATLKRAMGGTVGKRNPKPVVLDEAHDVALAAAKALAESDGTLAKKTYEHLNRDLPADLRAWLLELPSFLSKKGRKEQGLELCDVLRPLFGDAYLDAERAVVLWEAGDKEGGRAALAELRGRLPNHCWPLLRSGYVSEQEAHLADAQKHYEQAVEMARKGDNKKDLRFCWDGLVQHHHARHDQAKAVELSRQMLEECPELEQELKVETIRNDRPEPGRNDPCTCGSGKKFKRCCGAPR